ncbi:MAG: stage II sporulation protein D [Oscillospiraceae bacterium]|nr:stage II sporulation protein D [Oscillospiraceae bacterium]
MKQFWKDMGIAFTMGMIVPSVLLAAVVSLSANKSDIPPMTEPVSLTIPVSESETVMPQLQIPVLDQTDGIVQLPLNDYLTSVVLAEMPVSFEEEAIKAQSVVARTYTMRAVKGAAKHEGAAVCTNSACCQGYVAVEQFLNKGGKPENVEYVRNLVASTDGQVLTYDGNLIEATYFSCSGGVTEDAVAVWGTDVPYLQSVPSPGEENAAYYTDTVTFSATDFASKLGVQLIGEPSQWFSDVTYTAGGGVETMMIGGQTYAGTQLRKLLSLRSTAFTVNVEGDTITIQTRGYGHRVGMSQYGADAMAASGSTYPEILAYYYQGTQLTQYSD